MLSGEPRNPMDGFGSGASTALTRGAEPPPPNQEAARSLHRFNKRQHHWRFNGEPDHVRIRPDTARSLFYHSDSIFIWYALHCNDLSDLKGKSCTAAIGSFQHTALVAHLQFPQRPPTGRRCRASATWCRSGVVLARSNSGSLCA